MTEEYSLRQNCQTDHGKPLKFAVVTQIHEFNQSCNAC